MEAQHNEPAWRHKADFVLGVKITDSVWAKEYQDEQLAAREIGDSTFEICCIPFMIYDLCLGDVVKTDDEFNVNAIVKSGGHFGFRVATRDGLEQQEVVARAHEMGCLTERFSAKLCAIDAIDEDIAREVSGMLLSLREQGKIVDFETIKR